MKAYKYTWLLAILLFGACGKQEEAPDLAYIDSIAQWQQERISGLRKKDGWLSLVGLYWLPEGTKTFGTAGDFRLEGAHIPAQIGSFTRKGNEIWFEAANTQEKKRLNIDEPMQMGSLSWQIISRGDAYAVRVRDTLASTLASFVPPTYFPVNEQWKIDAQFIAAPDTVVIGNVTGQEIPTPIPGMLEFSVAGQVYRLKVLDGQKEYFVLFGDATNGTQTYGAGRYLYVPLADANGHTVIDFNKAISPPCAFTKYATCPLPMRSNILKIKIEAGEQAAH